MLSPFDVAFLLVMANHRQSSSPILPGSHGPLLLGGFSAFVVRPLPISVDVCHFFRSKRCLKIITLELELNTLIARTTTTNLNMKHSLIRWRK